MAATQTAGRIGEEDLANSIEPFEWRETSGSRFPAIGPFVVAGSIDNRMPELVESFKSL